jgi:hypothetical protein
LNVTRSLSARRPNGPALWEVEMRALTGTLLLVSVLAAPRATLAAYEDRPGWQRAGFTVLAGIENVVPITSAFAAPRCLPGYILCKASFAGISLLAAGAHLAFSFGSDMPQTRAILHRGFAGDWILTGRHAAGDAEVNVLPDPGPVARSTP